VSSHTRLIRHFAAAFLAAVAASFAAGVSAEERREVRAPFFGEVLFDFYQEKYFSSAVDLLVSRRFERLGPHRDEAELMLGGLYLSYGLHLQAGEIFDRLIAQGAPPSVRNRAWFYLAKIRYQRGYTDEALEALTRIDEQLPGELEDEHQVLRSTLLIGRGQYAEAVARLERLGRGSSWIPYARFNMGVALIKAGETEKGVALLEALGADRANSEELRTLKDKANVALGYAFLQTGNAARARRALERVRLDSLQSSKALLGMGWAWSSEGQHERSLVHWDELRGRNVADSAVQESLLAVPYALGKLGAWRQSLARYEDALLTYQVEMKRLDETIAAIRAGKLTEELLRLNPGEDMGWFWRLPRLPDTAASRYLLQLMASHEFQESLKNYRDLQFMRGNLQGWRDRLKVYDVMLANRRAGFNERLVAQQGDVRDADLKRLEDVHERYVADLERISVEDDTFALANERERAALERLQRVFEQLKRAGDDADAEAVEKYRRLRGVLLWDVHSEFKPRLWEAQQALRATDEQLTAAHRRRDALLRARKTMPKLFDEFAADIVGLGNRIAKAQADLDRAMKEQGDQLAGLAVAELEDQKLRLATYVTQARFAVAQIYDQAAAVEGTHAPVP
jgi:hypothetical protein